MLDIDFLSAYPLATARGSNSVTDPPALASGYDDKNHYQACLPKAHE